MRDPQTIANIATTSGLLAFVFGFFALCGAISHGDHPVVRFLGQATVFCFGLATVLGLLLVLTAIWS